MGRKFGKVIEERPLEVKLAMLMVVLQGFEYFRGQVHVGGLCNQLQLYSCTCTCVLWSCSPCTRYRGQQQPGWHITESLD
jgi:hypothetical protein